MWIYNLGLVLYVWAIALASPWHRKAKLWIDGRKGLFRRMKESIDPSARIIWIHAASLGEFEQGRPLIEKIRKEHPEYKILLTFFSLRATKSAKLRSGRLHLLPADRHAGQSPPFSGHRPPRNRHLRQIRILDQPAHRAAPPLDPQLHRIGHLPPQLDLLPPLRRLLAHGTRKFRHDLRSEQRFQKITGRTGLRQRRSRRRHPLRPGCRNCGCGEKKSTSSNGSKAAPVC
mgnify:FL=1